MNEERNIYIGDLHTHTPSSRCFKDAKNDNSYIGILSTAKSKNLSIIGITDHNSIEGYKKLMDIKENLQDELTILDGISDSEQASNKLKVLKKQLGLFEDLLILPGIEFEVNNGIHLLCLFNPNTSISEIKGFLKSGGYGKEDFGFESAKKISKWDIFTFFEETKKYDCVVIDAHTDSDKGILQTLDKGLPRAHCLSNAQLKGLCYKSEKQRSLLEKTFESSIEYQREIPLAYLKSSDAHAIQEVGRDTSYFQLKELTYKEFKNSFNNPLEYISTTLPAVKNIVDRIVKSGKYIGINKVDQTLLKQYICAFHNSIGGFIILGLNEHDGINGYDNEKIDNLIDSVISSFDSLSQKVDFGINPYPVQNNKFIVIINIKKGEKLIDIDTNGEVWFFDSKKIKKLSAEEIERYIEKSLTEKLQNKIIPRLKNVESESLEIRNILSSLPIIQKFEQKSKGIYSVIKEPDYKDPIKLSAEQKDSLMRYVKSKNNGKTKGNLLYLEDIMSPRLNNAYLRYSVPKYYLKGVQNHNKKHEHLIVIPGGATFYAHKTIEHFNDHEFGIINFSSKTPEYSNKFICCFLKSSFFLWYFNFKYDSLDFFMPEMFKLILLPILILKNPEHNKILLKMEDLFDTILKTELSFLKLDLKVNNDKYEEVIENHNNEIDTYSHEIDLLFYKLIDLSQTEIQIIESSLQANNIYIPKNN